MRGSWAWWVVLAASLLVLPACRGRPSPVTVVTSDGNDAAIAALSQHIQSLEWRVQELERQLRAATVH